MVRMQPLIQTAKKNGSFIKAYKLGKQLQGHLVEAQEAADWLETAIHVCESGECGAHLDRLISVGSKHLVVLEICADIVASNDPVPGLIVSPPVKEMRQWIGRWESAAVEAETLGLGRDISYRYWQQNIELPEVFIKAEKWFDTAEKLAKKVDRSRLMKFATDAGRHIDAVKACRNSYPRARRWTLQRSFIKWNMLVVEWMELVETLDQVQASDVSTKRISTVWAQMKMERRAKKADMLKKRTCSHCGKTAPLSQISFAYCGGCRDSRVARIDLPRYCSEACQRAHWLAGHKDECPCAKDL